MTGSIEGGGKRDSREENDRKLIFIIAYVLL